MNWNLASRIAHIAACQAHRDLTVDREGYVPVHAALGKAGIVAMARPMPRLFGMYYAPAQGGPGVLLNADLDVITQRHTAAHELGHHLLEHGTAYDNELDRSAQWGDGSWPDEEKAAEAFAAWFLMPFPAVKKALHRLGVDRPRTPADAYLVARALGTSYAGTVRHLVNLRLLGRNQGEQWLKKQPTQIKKSLAPWVTIPAYAHVHVVTGRMDGQTLHADAGDVIVLRLPDARLIQLSPSLAIRTSSVDGPTLWQEDQPTETVLQVTDELTGSTVIEAATDGGDPPLRVTMTRQSARHGIDNVWTA